MNFEGKNGNDEEPAKESGGPREVAPLVDESDDAAAFAELDKAVARGSDPITEEQLQFLEDVAELETEAKGLAADDLSEIIAIEDRENLGVPVEWPDLKGAVVNLAHYSSAAEKRNALERKYRERKGIAFGVRLGPHVEEQLWRTALFGTVVRGWSGFKLGGKLLVFNEINYRRLISIRRFRTFVLSKSMDVETFRRATDESAAGN